MGRTGAELFGWVLRPKFHLETIENTQIIFLVHFIMGMK